MYLWQRLQQATSDKNSLSWGEEEEKTSSKWSQGAWANCLIWSYLKCSGNLSSEQVSCKISLPLAAWLLFAVVFRSGICRSKVKKRPLGKYDLNIMMKLKQTATVCKILEQWEALVFSVALIRASMLVITWVGSRFDWWGNNDSKNFWPEQQQMNVIFWWPSSWQEKYIVVYVENIYVNWKLTKAKLQLNLCLKIFSSLFKQPFSNAKEKRIKYCYLMTYLLIIEFIKVWQPASQCLTSRIWLHSRVLPMPGI